MHPSLEHLKKILDLEIKDGYPNKAVIGGLPKMLTFWEPNARRAGFDAAFVDDVVARIRAYPDQSPDDRAASVQALLALIKDAAPAHSVGPTVSPRVQSSPPPTAGPTPPAPPPAPERQPPPHSAQPTRPPASERPQPQPERPPAPAPRPSPKPERPPPPPPVEPPETGPQPQPAIGEAALSSVSIAPPSAPSAPREAVEQKPRKAERSYFDEEPVAPRPRRPAGPQPLKAAAPFNAGAGLDAPLTVLHGVGPETESKLKRLGLQTLRDVLLYFPRRYDDYSKLKTINRLEYGEECTLIGAVWEAHTRRIRGGQATLLKVVVSDSTGMLEMTFFNQPWLEKHLTAGKQIVVSGRVDQYLGRLTLVPEEWEYLDRELLNTGRIVPVYRLTAGVLQRGLRRITSQVVTYWARRQPDPLPAEIVERAGLMPYGEALFHIHFPDSAEALAAARHRLAFDELLLLQLGVLRQRKEWQAASGAPLAVPDDWLASFVGALPYALTNAQQRALADVRADLARSVPMNRLLQGDVGSGKTAVAAAALAIAAQAGAQAALMAPTSILAEQHYRTLCHLLEPAIPNPQYAIRLLQGSTPQSEKEAIYEGLRSGAVKVVVGTHALIEGPVEFARLGLVIVDEQHRFGVAQRAALRGKGANPHLLVMTATPIPRTLALTVYGDLDLSVLDEMPPGRQPIQTRLLHATERERGFAFIRSQAQKGRQAFIIFPLVEESDAKRSEAKAAVDEHARLQQEVFPELRLGLLHGRMKADEKDDVMARFRAGEYHILVSTSVVEVGVDVPNATVMLVEGANRFGLAQLHQFRGRVGRGEHASYCLLVSDALNPRLDERLAAMEQSQDGFYLAEKDLELRGPGDFLGTRQSGFAGLRMAKLSDIPTIEKARREAQRLFQKDPELKAPEHAAIAENLARFWSPGAGDVS
jgi:ATP-dependent DNA helicase RecG